MNYIFLLPLIIEGGFGTQRGGFGAFSREQQQVNRGGGFGQTRGAFGSSRGEVRGGQEEQQEGMYNMKCGRL